jgi:hypothetical protein
MNYSERFFNPPRRLTGLLWLKLWIHEESSNQQEIPSLMNHRTTTFMLSKYAWLIPETGTVRKTASPPQAQNPIGLSNDQPRFPVPAVSSLEASPTPAR